MGNCAICEKTHDLFELKIPETEEYPSITRYVCAKCWETIARISELASEQTIMKLALKIKNLEEKIEHLEGKLDTLDSHEVSPYEAIMIVERARNG